MTTAEGVAGIVLAAGEGVRFGSAKQLAELGGRPLLEYPLAVLASAPLERRLVVLGCEADRVMESVDLHGCEPVLCEGWEEGQARSLACGIEAAGEADAVLVLVGDQPGVTPDAVARVLDARGEPGLAVRATYGGSPGHPVLLERELFGEILALKGDAGARLVLDRLKEGVVEVPCDDVASGLDVDTSEDMERAVNAWE